MFERLGQVYKVNRARLFRKDLQAANMQQVNEIRTLRGEMHPLPAKAPSGELLDDISSRRVATDPSPRAPSLERAQNGAPRPSRFV